MLQVSPKEQRTCEDTTSRPGICSAISAQHVRTQGFATREACRPSGSPDNGSIGNRVRQTSEGLIQPMNPGNADYKDGLKVNNALLAIVLHD
jgi:hypothetical protein